MQLIGDRLLVRPIPHDNKTPGGLELPDSAKPRYHRSEVVQVASVKIKKDDASEPLDLAAGDVVYHFSAGTDFEFAGEKLKLLSECELFAIE